MGFSKKTIHRDETSGLFVQDDITSGEYSVNELNARMAARQQALNDGNKAEWSNLTVDSPDYGNAMSRQPKPSDAVTGSADHYGDGQEAPPKKGGPVQKPAAKPGIQGAETSRG